MTDEMIINGIRYVPAVTATPMISEVLRVLAGLVRDPEEIDPQDYRHLRIHVREVDSLSEDGTTFDEFAARLAEVIARRVASQEGPQEPLSARERRIASLAGLVGGDKALGDLRKAHSAAVLDAVRRVEAGVFERLP